MNTNAPEPTGIKMAMDNHWTSAGVKQSSKSTLDAPNLSSHTFSLKKTVDKKDRIFLDKINLTYFPDRF